jgi:hypothetical protein
LCRQSKRRDEEQFDEQVVIDTKEFLAVALDVPNLSPERDDPLDLFERV